MAVSPLFQFSVDGHAASSFHVVEFTGSEALSELYTFDCLLISTLGFGELDALPGKKATLTINGDSAPCDYHGIIAEFTVLDQIKGNQYCRATLRPELFKLSLTEDIRVFLDIDLPTILSKMLDESSAGPVSYDNRLTGQYPQHDFLSQHNESDLDFLNRWLEHYGAYFFFDQDAGGKMIITDDSAAHAPHPAASGLQYSRVTGLDATHREEVVSRFDCRVRQTVGSVSLNDYHSSAPSRSLAVSESVRGDGTGEEKFYGANYRLSADGKVLAKRRAELNGWPGRTFRGRSTVPYLRTGVLYTLSGADDPSLDQQYLMVRVEHSGRQTAYLTDGLGLDVPFEEAVIEYTNRFMAIEDSVQFRPELKTSVPEAVGVVTAFIDTPDSQYSTPDDDGRYKVRFAFDRSEKPEGKVSKPVRLAQPYSGPDYGMHFPLLAGTEVVVSHINGDVDRPVMLGSISNSEQPTPVNDQRGMLNTLRTAGENRLFMDDLDGKERIVLRTVPGDTWMRVGEYRSFEDVEKNVADTAKQAAGHMLSEAGTWLKGTLDGTEERSTEEIKEELKEEGYKESLRVVGAVFKKITGHWVGTDGNWSTFIGQDANHMTWMNCMNVTLGEHTRTVGGDGLKMTALFDVRMHRSAQTLVHTPNRIQLTPMRIDKTETLVEQLQNKIKLVDIHKRKIKELTEKADLEISLANKVLLTTEEVEAGEASSVFGDKVTSLSEQYDSEMLSMSSSDSGEETESSSDDTGESSGLKAKILEKGQQLHELPDDEESDSEDGDEEEAEPKIVQEAKMAIALFNEATENADSKHIKETLMRLKVALEVEREIDTRKETSTVSIVAAQNKDSSLDNLTVDSLVSVAVSESRTLGNLSVTLGGKIVVLGV